MPGFDRKNILTVSEGKSAPVRKSRFGGPASGTSQDVEPEANGAQTQLMAAIDSVFEGFALFDADDRMVFCNRRFREQNPVLALNGMTGMSFEEMLRENIATGQILNAIGDEEAYIRARMEQHRNPSGPLVQHRGDGRWLELREERTPDGATLLVNTDITERNQAEEALKNSELHLSQAQQLAHLGSWVWNIRTGEEIWSDEQFRIFGYEPQEIESTYDAFLGAVHPDDRDFVRKTATDALNGHAPYSCEYRIVRPDGVVRYLRVQGKLSLSADGQPEKMFGASLDITESKRAEEALKNSESILSQAAQIAHLGSWSWNVRTGKEIWSDEQYRIFGYEPQEIESTYDAFLGALHPDDRDHVIKALDDTLNGLAPYSCEFRIVRPDGGVTHVRAQGKLTLSADGQADTMLGIVLDITERKQAEAALRESEARLLKAAGMAKIGYWVWDEVEDKTIYCSEELAKTYGVASGAELAAEFSSRAAELEWIHPEDRERFAEVDRTAKEMKRGYDTEYRIIDSAGEVRHLHVIGELVLDERGDLIRSNGITQDITEQIRAKEQLRQAQKMEAVGQLTAGVAHDFNNMLAVISGNAEMLEYEFGADNPQLAAVQRATKRAADLTQRLLAFSSKQMLHPETINANNLIAETTGLLRSTLEEHIDIETVAAAGLWNCEVDPAQLENALVNLAVNARDAMPDGGKLTIETANVRLDGDDDAVVQAEVTPGQYVMLAVTDTGTGMPPEVREHVFEPFFTTKAVGDGSGLGLSMVYGFVKQSGGHVTITSEQGEGTTIKIYLPRSSETETAEQRPATDEVPVARGETVLVVEDDLEVRKLAVALLRDLGYRIVEAATGAAALDQLRSATGVNLLLTDVVLAGGMNGRELAAEVERRASGIPVLYMSGYTEDAIMHHGRLDADAELLQKPFRRADLARAVRRALDGPSA